MPPEAGSPLALFERTLSRVVARVWLAQLCYAAAASAVAASLLGVTGVARPIAIAIALVAAVAALVAVRRSRTRSRAAVLVEWAVPGSRNTVITAEELMMWPERASAWMRAKVIADAARLASGVSLSAVRPLVTPAFVLLAALAVSAVLLTVPLRVVTDMREAAQRSGAPRADAVSLSVVIEPPRYTQRPTVREVDPEHVEALEGSMIRLAVSGAASPWRLRFGSRVLPVTADGTAAMLLTESGYLALEPADAAHGAARLVPLTVTPDRAPTVRIDAPARDLMVPDADRRIAVTASASDDIALDRLELRYTKVSGTGEDFEFVEGSLPIALRRASETSWSAAADIALASLQLEPGDSIVYRAVARDRRPGTTGEASSDTFFIEVAGPGQVALEGFELPPEQERYALSQQMVVLKIERLRARERAMSRPTLQASTAAIAAEQRAVRANFIFLMGGHVEDEEVEAAQSNEIQEGRLENMARREISTAVHLMTRVEQGLMSVSTVAALPPAKSAVEALQRAFGRNRYILRTPPSRAEIDPSRRLSGTLTAATSWRRDRYSLVADAKAQRVDAFVAAVLVVSKRMAAGETPRAAWFGALAEQALAIEPGAREWQQAAARLATLRDRVAKGSSAPQILAQLDEAVKPALDAAQAASRPPAGPGTKRATALGRAWAQEPKR